jgi:hypothetical protein
VLIANVRFSVHSESASRQRPPISDPQSTSIPGRVKKARARL